MRFTSRLMTRTLAASVSCVIAVSAPLAAQALSATPVIEKEVTIITDDGQTQTRRIPADRMVPGDRVIYTLNIVNDQAEPATDLVLTVPVAKELTFIEGSADKPGISAAYSADGGQSFASRQAVMVMDASGNVRAASADEITHVRWTVPGPVASGEGDALSFAATLK